MKSILSLLLVALFVAVASAQNNETILQVLAQQPLYSQLSANIAGSPIEATLNDSNINVALLAHVNQEPPLNFTNEHISYHVLTDTTATPFKDGDIFATLLSLASLKGGFQRVKASVNATGTYFGPNLVTLNNTTLEASNGVIHGISNAMTLPGDLESLTASVDDLKTLSTFLHAANITLDDSVAGVTAFAPSNAAFTALQVAKPLVYDYLAVAGGVADLQAVLKLHVATSIIYSNESSTTLIVATLNGAEVTVTLNGSVVTVSNAGSSATATSVNNLASNGVAHVIDQVLIPSNFTFTLRKALLGLKLNKFEQALASLNLTQYLDNTAPFTLFAPTDAALDGKTVTADLLKYHVVEGSHTAFATSGLVQSQLGLSSSNNAFQQLTINVDGAKNVTTVNGVALPAAQDVGTTVGVIYVLDTVLTPPSKSIVQTAVDGGFTKLVSAATFAGVADVLQSTTVFAPRDTAFTGPVADYLLLNTTQSNADLANVLKYHVAAGNNIYYVNGKPELPETVATLNGDVSANLTANPVVLNGKAQIVQADILASNGVVHAIDTVLIPADFALTSDKVVKGFKATDFLNGLTQANLTEVLTSTDAYTIFAFTDAAYDRAPRTLTSNPSRWPSVLKTHIFNGTIASLVAGHNYTMLSGEVLQVVSATSVQVVGAESAGKPAVVGGPVSANNGVVYLIDGILSVQAVEPSDDGLSDTAIGFIVIGCIIGVLLIIGAAGGGYWYYRRRAGYEQIGSV